MKKKIVNVLLSVAVVTTMMFTATACGAKDKDTTPVEPAAVTNDEPSSEANADDVDNTDADDENNADAANDDADAADDADGNDGDNVSVAEWIQSEEAVSFVNEINSQYADQGASIELEADGDTLVMKFIYSEAIIGTDGSDLTDEQIEAIQTTMEQQFESIGGLFKPMGDAMKEEIGISSIRISFNASNGATLYTMDL